MKSLFILFCVSLLSSCSLAPFNTVKTARTLGDGNWEIDTGFSPALYFTTSRGFSDDFDAGVMVERQFFPVFGLFGKYSFLNKKDDEFSASVYGGGFLGVDVVESSGFFLGPVLSYKASWFEPYIVIKYNWVKWKGQDLNGDEKDDLFVDLFRFDDIEFSYMQYVLGFNFWCTEGFALNINAKYFSFFGSDVSDDADALFGFGFTWRL